MIKGSANRSSQPPLAGLLRASGLPASWPMVRPDIEIIDLTSSPELVNVSYDHPLRNSSTQSPTKKNRRTRKNPHSGSASVRTSREHSRERTRPKDLDGRTVLSSKISSGERIVANNKPRRDNRSSDRQTRTILARRDRHGPHPATEVPAAYHRLLPVYPMESFSSLTLNLLTFLCRPTCPRGRTLLRRVKRGVQQQSQSMTSSFACSCRLTSPSWVPMMSSHWRTFYLSNRTQKAT